MKSKSLIAVCLLAMPLFATLSGCNDETVADPEIVKARDEQRRAMQPQDRQGEGAQQPANQSGPGQQGRPQGGGRPDGR